MLAIVEPRKPDAEADRRSGLTRQRLLMRVVKLVCESGEYPCVMLDVSETGTKLRLFAGHPTGSFMLVELSNGETYPVERRWTKDGIAGFRFVEPVNVADFINEPSLHARRPVRLRTRCPVEYTAAGQHGHAVLVDLSARGACLEAGRQLPVGSALKVQVGERPARFGHVCWRAGYRHGLAFQEDMPLSDLARLAAELQPFGKPGAARAEPSVALSA